MSELLELSEHPRADAFRKQKQELVARGGSPEGLPSDAGQFEDAFVETVGVEQVGA
jgi:hypothetical protein